MTKKNICAFSTADDKYAVSSAVSLLSVRKKSPDIDLFLIGTTYSTATKKFLKKHNITPIEINLSDRFHTSWDYPIECYYIFAGPELLHKRGYRYSAYVDGDVYCNSNPFDFDLTSIKDFAGTFTKSSIAAILGSDTEVATRIFGNEETLQESRIQTGIVYFNNDSLVKREFLEKITDVYQKAIDRDIPRKGDDSLFALFRLAYPTWGYLDLGDYYNKVTSGAQSIGIDEWVRRDQEVITDGVFFHFTNHTKPWKNTSRFPTYTHEYFYHAWRRHAIDTLTDEELQTYYPEIHAVLSDDHLRFYWYPTENVGDLITPYFLEKVCGVTNTDEYAISEHKIKQIERWGLSRRAKIRRLPSRLVMAIIRRVDRLKVRVGMSRSQKQHIIIPERRAQYAVSTGSVIRLCGNKALVYGSGIRDKHQQTHQSSVRLVRGPLTRQRFLDNNYPCPPIYGDPGLLLPRFYEPQQSKRRYSIGIIPHFTEYEDIVEKYKDDDSVLVINMASGDLEGVIDQITSCDRTVSSSLHGLVISHAYGIPTRQIEYSDRINGDGTKFLDYYGGIGMERIAPIDGEGCKYISPDELKNMKYETLKDYNDQSLMDAMFFDTKGFRSSARYPYA